MGEMADYFLESMSDIEYGAHGEPYDGFDNVMYDEESGRYLGPGSGRSRVMKCRYCGLDGLRWGLSDRGWRLYNGDNMHSCSKYKPVR